MFMRVKSSLPGGVVYPEIAGRRVLITGLRRELGVDIARAFADHGARLAVHTPHLSEDLTELGAVLADTAEEVRLFDTPLDDKAAAVAFAQGPAMAAFGGLDAAVNLISFDASDVAAATTGDAHAIESLITDKLANATLSSRVIANRMRLTLSPGIILHVVTVPAALDDSTTAFAALVHATLGDLIRTEAASWAEHGIRMNAIGPPAFDPLAGDPTAVASESDLAAVALYLTSDKAQGLTGHMLDARGLADNGTIAKVI